MDTKELFKKDNDIYQDKIKGARQLSNFIWILILAIGGFGFLLASLECYLKKNILPFADTQNLEFIPQGIVMLFYGTVASGLMIYIIFLVIWDIGGGSNEFDKNDQIIRIIRKGFPGKNQKILITYSFEKIKSIEISIEEGLNPRRNIILCTKDQRRIPLYPSSELFSLEVLEERATEIANLIGVNLEGNF